MGIKSFWCRLPTGRLCYGLKIIQARLPVRCTTAARSFRLFRRCSLTRCIAEPGKLSPDSIISICRGGQQVVQQTVHVEDLLYRLSISMLLLVRSSMIVQVRHKIIELSGGWNFPVRRKRQRWKDHQVPCLIQSHVWLGYACVCRCVCVSVCLSVCRSVFDIVFILYVSVSVCLCLLLPNYSLVNKDWYIVAVCPLTPATHDTIAAGCYQFSLQNLPRWRLILRWTVSVKLMFIVVRAYNLTRPHAV